MLFTHSSAEIGKTPVRLSCFQFAFSWFSLFSGLLTSLASLFLRPFSLHPVFYLYFFVSGILKGSCENPTFPNGDNKVILVRNTNRQPFKFHNSYSLVFFVVFCCCCCFCVLHTAVSSSLIVVLYYIMIICWCVFVVLWYFICCCSFLPFRLIFWP